GAANWGREVPPPTPTAAELEDQRILNEVNRVLSQSPGLQGADVGVRVAGTIVVLTGKVDTKEQYDLAENLSVTVDGVSHVKNDLLILRPEVAAPQKTQPKDDSASTPDNAATPPAPKPEPETPQELHIKQLLAQGKEQLDAQDYQRALFFFNQVIEI